MNKLTQSGSNDDHLFVVGVGASAGGLEALEKMFDHVPSDLPGMAFVLVQHLSPDFKSLMDELLARHTSLAIHRVEDGMIVEAGAIYLIPPQMDMIISDGRLLLSQREDNQQLSLPIDHFFRSLAQDCGNSSIGIILSGTGSDGSRGVRKIHEAGGLVVAQNEETARFHGMPRAAIDTGVVDAVVQPAELGPLLVRYSQEPVREQIQRALDEPAPDESATSTLFRLLQKEYGLDFRHYKSTTISRRVQRRISITHCSSIEDYAEKVTVDHEERRALYHDLLIGVTRFFRDDTAFKALSEELSTRLLSLWQKDSIRIWVCACATGEEAYSMAILLHERMTALDREPDVKIFATDIDRGSLDFASQGIYPKASLGEMSAARRQRYFNEVDNGYQISQEIRQMIVFAPHNILRDAPFTSLHLVSCRNLLIYLNADAQRKALSLFHFALKTDGLLLLGSSESSGELSDEFSVIEKEARLYSKLRDLRLPPDLRNPLDIGSIRPRGPSSLPRKDAPRSGSELMSAYDQLLAEFMPPGVLVDDTGSVMQMFGDGAKFLSLRPGRMSNAILDLVDGDLKLALSGAIQRVRSTSEPVNFGSVRVSADGEGVDVRLSVTPQHQRSGRTFLLIRFEAIELPSITEPIAPSVPISESAVERIKTLESELQYTKENLQATVEELETSNEELQATNEELVASNEELQSTNEELHSVNEELYTVNAEYQRKIVELTELSADIDNLLASTEVHTVFLDHELQIRRFTPRSVEVFNFVSADIGRKFESFTNRLDLSSLTAELEQVLETSEPFEKEVRDPRNTEFLLRILPYRTNAGVTGVVLTLVNISSVKNSERLFESVFNSAPHGMLLTDPEGRIALVNRQLQRLSGYEADELQGELVDVLVPEASRGRHVEHRNAYMKSPVGRRMGKSLDLVAERKDGGEFPVEVGLNPIPTVDGVMILATVVDITERLDAQRQIVEREKELRVITDNVPAMISRMDRDFRFRFVNQGFCDAWGRSADQLLALTLPDLIGDEATARATPKLRQALEGDSGSLEFVMNRPDGSAFWAALIYSPDIVDGKVEGLFVTVIDTTELKQAENRHDRAIEGAGDGLYEWKLEGQEFFAAARFWELIGRPDHSKDGTLDEFLQLVHSDDRDAIQKEIQRHIDGETVAFEMEYRVQMSDGRYRWFSGRGRVGYDALGHESRFAGSIRDIHDRKELEFTLRDQVSQRDQFLAMLSHELRNPLGAISSAVSVASQTGMESGSGAHCFRTIESQVRHMRHLLDDLLDVSRISHNKLKLKVATFDLTASVTEVVDSLQPRIEAAGLTLAWKESESAISVEADQERVIQCLVNLVTNAIKYSTDGEAISMSVKSDNEGVTVAVADTGIGMTAELRDRVFDLFSQADESLARSEGGMGVGLALVKGIIELHGGRVAAESDGPGAGSTFSFWIPFRASDSNGSSNISASAPLKRAPTSRGSRQSEAVPAVCATTRISDVGVTKIVLIDDLAAGRQMLAMWLENEGVQVIQAESGRSGLAAVRKTNPDFVLIDVGLPDISGYEVARTIKENEATNTIPLVAVTGYGRDPDMSDSVEAGFDLHLIKPVNLAELHEFIISHRLAWDSRSQSADRESLIDLS